MSFEELQSISKYLIPVIEAELLAMESEHHALTWSGQGLSPEQMEKCTALQLGIKLLKPPTVYFGENFKTPFDDMFAEGITIRKPK